VRGAGEAGGVEFGEGGEGKVMQSMLFDDNVRKIAHYLVFHDESEPIPNKGWLLIGLLFVKEEHLCNIEGMLNYHRRQENYDGEIHFCKLPKSFDGEFGAKARVARRWMRDYQDGMCQDALFTCLAVNRASPKFERERFKEDFHAYNRFTAMAIKAGVSYLLQPLGYDVIELTVVSDGKDRKSRPMQGIVDNFEDYLHYRVELDNMMAQLTTERHYPTVKMQQIRVISSEQNNLLQLTDLLLGSLQVAMFGISNRPVKRELARMVSSWYQDLQRPPTKQQYKMHRKFNVWGFPDDQGKPFHHFSMAVYPNGAEQLLLF
jgi:hypothetical protein